MKNILLASGLIILSIFIPSSILAHPGRTASDGCHYCRTNCDRWDVGWNVRYCHNGYSEPEPIYIAPVATKKPATPKPIVSTPKPTVNPIIASTETPTITPISTPEVKGESTEATTIPAKAKDSTTSNPIGSLIGLGIFLFAGYKGLKWLGKK